jgi:hypothetical protein
LFGGRGQHGANVSTREIDAGSIALRPDAVRLVIRPADALSDDSERHDRVRAAEKTAMGRRVQIDEVHP